MIFKERSATIVFCTLTCDAALVALLLVHVHHVIVILVKLFSLAQTFVVRDTFVEVNSVSYD